MNKSCSLIVGVIATFFLAGCIPESKNAISPLAGARQDASLNGAWVAEDAEAARYLHIGAELEKAADPDAPEPEAGLMRFWLVTHRKDDGRVGVEKPFSMRFFVSQVGEDRYANALLPFENTDAAKQKEPTRYLFFKYKVDGDQLILSGINWQATAEAIARHELDGSVTREGPDLKSVNITATSDQLRPIWPAPAPISCFLPRIV